MTVNVHHEMNRASWNQATVAHNSHKVDQHLFFKNKGSTLFKEEKDLLGNLSGLKVCHIQCNAGQDTLSLVTRLGAQNPTGVDISDTAVDFATQLAKDAGIEATFIRSDVLDYFVETEPEQFDVVFASYGVIGWIASMEKYTAGIARILKPGGRFCLVEFHPTQFIFDRNMAIAYPYTSNGEHFQEDTGVRDYVALSDVVDGQELMPNMKYAQGVQDFRNTNPTNEFCWGLADVMGNLCKAGLQMTQFEEYPYSNFCKMFHDMTVEKVEEGLRYRNVGPMLPMMYSVSFKKPERF
ncbi:hypothetical protein BGZ83_004070 [Gryganskiella cystojenkinii]|nr:hypothetical protein BGZ83_004070 [Gryganskiella cystojenkinii]